MSPEHFEAITHRAEAFKEPNDDIGVRVGEEQDVHGHAQNGSAGDAPQRREALKLPSVLRTFKDMSPKLMRKEFNQRFKMVRRCHQPTLMVMLPNRSFATLIHPYELRHPSIDDESDSKTFSPGGSLNSNLLWLGELQVYCRKANHHIRRRSMATSPLETGRTASLASSMMR